MTSLINVHQRISGIFILWILGLPRGFCADRIPVPPITNAGPVDPNQDSIESEWESYRRRARSMKKHHDSGALEERDVLKVLTTAGVVPFKGQVFRPFHVPVFKGRWRWPLRAGIVSSEFGRRWGRNHDGLDIAADAGVPVYAAAPGKVLYAGNGLRGYGNVVIVRHDQKTTSLYAHNLKLLVRSGEEVQRDQVIALLGSSGRSTGPHVHFEIRVRSRAVDPRHLLSQNRYFPSKY